MAGGGQQSASSQKLKYATYITIPSALHRPSQLLDRLTCERLPHHLLVQLADTSTL